MIGTLKDRKIDAAKKLEQVKPKLTEEEIMKLPLKERLALRNQGKFVK